MERELLGVVLPVVIDKGSLNGLILSHYLGTEVALVLSVPGWCSQGLAVELMLSNGLASGDSVEVLAHGWLREAGSLHLGALEGVV